MDPDWVRDIREQCRRARVPFFFKQWGGVMKSKNGRVLDNRTWDEMPKVTIPRAMPSQSKHQRVHLPLQVQQQ
jgi:protein gp37